jgi:hypothetical protein
VQEQEGQTDRLHVYHQDEPEKLTVVSGRIRFVSASGADTVCILVSEERPSPVDSPHTVQNAPIARSFKDEKCFQTLYSSVFGNPVYGSDLHR